MALDRIGFALADQLELVEWPKSTSAWTSGRGLVATHYNAGVDERKEHS